MTHAAEGGVLPLDVICHLLQVTTYFGFFVCVFGGGGRGEPFFFLVCIFLY